MRLRFGLLALTLSFLIAGAAASALGDATVAHRIWLIGVVVMGAPLVVRTIGGVIRCHLATDVVASLSILGAIALGQPLAGLVIVLMQGGGETLEKYAERRASAAIRQLEAAAPQLAHRLSDGAVIDVSATTVAVGDTLLIRPGDAIPCDGVVLSGDSDVDTSSLTGEPVPVHVRRDSPVMSGALNGLGSFTMCVTAPAAQSQYARIVELVRSAQASKAPLQRLADRYAVWFTPITVGLCAVAVGVTHDWMRALAILVVATPCPLILATPVAIIGGINRAAKRLIIVRSGAALEQLGATTTAVFDKTGTITVGRPRVQAIGVTPGFDRRTVLSYAAAVEEHSSHLLARVVVDAAREEGIEARASDRHAETPGQGISGIVDGHVVRVGSRTFVTSGTTERTPVAAARANDDAILRAYVSIDGRMAATVEFADELRAELPRMLSSLARNGVERVILLSGDHRSIAEAFAARAGIPEAHGDLLPGDKVRFIEHERAGGHVVMMVGDGINDAPALVAADVGVALAAHGEGVTAEAADVIVLADSIDRVAEAVDIGRRTMRIARQSIGVGLGLSGIAMIVAAFGALAPIRGAMLQEVIDVAVILNALRTAASPRTSSSVAQRRGDATDGEGDPERYAAKLVSGAR